MDSILNFLARSQLKVCRLVLYFSVKCGFSAAVIYILQKAIKPLRSERTREGMPRLVAISFEKARGDAEILAEAGEFDVYVLSINWLFILYLAVYGKKKQFVGKFFNPQKTEASLVSRRKKYHELLMIVIPKIFSKYGLQGVLGFAVHYRQDYDFGIVSEKLGFPYMVLHRENMFDNSGHREYLMHKSRLMGKFQGGLLITHNEVTRKCFVKTNYAKEEEVKALGCLRMDAWSKRVRALNGMAGPAKEVVLFSFPIGVGILKPNQLDLAKNKNWPDISAGGFHQLFESVHGGFIALASEFPDIKFTIKTKSEPFYFDEIKKLSRNRGFDLSAIPNFELTSTRNVHKLIEEARVVIAFGSTVLLESGITSTPTILPLYHEAKLKEWEQYVHYFNDLDAFLVVEDEEALKTLVRTQIELPSFSMEKTKKCEVLFEKYVSSLTNPSVGKHVKEINKIMEKYALNRALK